MKAGSFVGSFDAVPSGENNGQVKEFSFVGDTVVWFPTEGSTLAMDIVCFDGSSMPFPANLAWTPAGGVQKFKLRKTSGDNQPFTLLVVDGVLRSVAF